MNFYQQVFHITKAIPRGQVATYGQIAAALGSPRAARQVGQALAHCTADIPWQRVINRHGMISIENMAVPKEEQALRLRQEGIIVTEKDNNFYVDLNQHLVDPAILLKATESIRHEQT